MYKHPSPLTMMTGQDRFNHEKEAFNHYKDLDPVVTSKQEIKNALKYYNKLKKILDDRIQDYFFLIGIRQNLDFAESYKLLSITKEEITVSYEAYNRNVNEYVDQKIYIPIDILHDPEFLIKTHNRIKLDKINKEKEEIEKKKKIQEDEYELKKLTYTNLKKELTSEDIKILDQQIELSK